MIKRHYVFEVLVFFPAPVEFAGLKKDILRFAGVAFHKSWRPNPGAAYNIGMQHAMEQMRAQGLKNVHPMQLEMTRFERIQ